MINNPVINILDEITANKIAAGEVVERPASVVKELVENSLDAMATNIEIDIADGGTSYIRVTDNGIGMSKENAEKAILRHATSKIKSADDLHRIMSLGFRGEALPSIASVSKFTLMTRPAGNELATKLVLNGGRLVEISETGAAIGTTVIVQDLFYNTPARRKFLKTNSTEASHISEIMTKLSLARPDTAIKLINNDRLILNTPGDNSLANAICGIYGPKVKPELLPITSSNEGGISVHGFVSTPALLKATRAWQTIIINSRIVHSRFISKAIDNAYQSLLPSSGFPLAVIHLKVPANIIDVNVHPQKTEVKFSDERQIYQLIYHAIKDALLNAREPSVYAAPVELKKYNTHWQKQNVQNIPPLVKAQEQLSFSAVREEMKSMSEEIYIPQQAVESDEAIDNSPPYMSIYPLGQINNLYIIAQSSDGLYIIDQHAAHERILYDRLCKNANTNIPVEILLVPVSMDFEPAEIDIILSHENTFKKLGFLLDQIGPKTMRISECPSGLKIDAVNEVIRNIITYLNDKHTPTWDELKHRILQTAACKSAIKAGDSLNMRQMQALVQELCKTELPFTCPHGRPAMVKITLDDLAKLFKRT